jgi:hypothetical protein
MARQWLPRVVEQLPRGAEWTKATIGGSRGDICSSASCKGGARTSKLPALIDLVFDRPLVSSDMIADVLGVAGGVPCPLSDIQTRTYRW